MSIVDVSDIQRVQALFLGDPFSAVSMLVKQGSQTRAITARRIPLKAMPMVLKEQHRISQTFDSSTSASLAKPQSDFISTQASVTSSAFHSGGGVGGVNVSGKQVKC